MGTVTLYELVVWDPHLRDWFPSVTPIEGPLKLIEKICQARVLANRCVNQPQGVRRVGTVYPMETCHYNPAQVEWMNS